MRGHPPDARATTGSRPSCWSSWSTLARDGDHRPHGRRRAPGQSHPHADYCGWPAGAREASMALIPKRASASRHRCHSDPAILRYAPQRHFKASARPELSFSGDPYCGASLNRRVAPKNPMVGRFFARCARAASGHAAAPPSATSNSRRPMVTDIRPSRAKVHNRNDTVPRECSLSMAP
jgi:hypothetical protein